MSSDHKQEKIELVPVELKYCERCGGLWVRERGAEEVYCEKCQVQEAELPAPKRKVGRVGAREAEVREMEVAGGVA